MAYNSDGEDLAQHRNIVRSYLARFHRPWYTVDDLLQDTFLQASQTIRNRGPPERPVPWLLSIARRTATRQLRQEERHRRKYLVDIVAEAQREPVQDLLHHEIRSRLGEAIQRLST